MNIIEKTVDVLYFLDVAEEEKKGESETNEKIFVLTLHKENHNKIYNLLDNSVNYCFTSNSLCKSNFS
ncbi:MAG: hypothetical protein AAF934_04455 [Bacteroidota bacterium]